MKLSEITIQRVRQAYKRTGLIPAKGSARHKSPKCACALEVLAKNMKLPSWTEVLNRNETIGFYVGFDGYSKRDNYGDPTAYKLGKQIAKELGL